MAKKNDAQRAAKKHAKEKKRQKKLAARPREASEVDVLAQWKPATHGIEGLARLLRTDSHDAAVLADHMAKGGRKDAKVAWIPARVRALSTEALLAELAHRGVVTDEAAFVAMAEGYESSRKLAVEQWAPSVAEGASVHDRDLVGEAAEVLWERWMPARVTDEQLRDRFRDAEDADPDACAAQLLALLDDALPGGGLARLGRAGISGRKVLNQLPATLGAAEAVETPRVLATLRKLRAAETAGSIDWHACTFVIADVLERREGIHAALDELLARAAEHPDDPALLSVAAEILAWSDDADPALDERLKAAYHAAIAANEGDVRAAFEAGLADFEFEEDELGDEVGDGDGDEPEDAPVPT